MAGIIEASRSLDKGRLLRLRDEIEHRNRDNTARTDSYLELYALTVEHPPDLPWVLMAHLVSRNAGYLMSDLASAIERRSTPFSRRALEELFAFLERANYLIFHDAWWHVTTSLAEGAGALDARTPSFVRAAWRRYEQALGAGLTESVERALVLDLVENEQNYIERRVAHHPRYATARSIVGFNEHVGAERAIVLPATEARIRVGGFASIERRIAAGHRIFDEVLADRRVRRDAFTWALATPHTGSRAAHGRRPSPTVREAWPLSRVIEVQPDVHAPPEPDPGWP